MLDSILTIVPCVVMVNTAMDVLDSAMDVLSTKLAGVPTADVFVKML